MSFELDPKESREFLSELSAGEFLHVEVEQVSANIELELELDRPVGRFWRTNLQPWAWGYESAYALAEDSVPMRVIVRSLGTRPGTVTLKVVHKSLAGERELRRYRAEAAFHSTRSDRSRQAVSPEVLEVALGASEEFADLGLPLRQSRALNRAATLQILLGQPLEAIPLAEDAITVAQQFNGLWEECSARLVYAEAVYSRSMEEAIEEEQYILDRFDATEVPPCTLKVQRLLVYDLSLQGAHERILELFEAGMALAEELDATKEAADLLLNVGSLHRYRGDAASALEVFSQARDRYEALGDERSRTLAVDNLGMVLRDLGDFEGALQMQSIALAAFREASELRNLAYGYLSFGDTLLTLGRAEEAREAYRSGAQISGQAQEPGMVGRAEWRLAQIALEEGDLDEAHRRLESASKTYREIGNPMGEALASLWLAKYKEAKNQLEAALQDYRAVAVAATRIGNRDLEMEAREGAAILLRKKGETGAASRELQRAIFLAERLQTQAPTDRLRRTSSPLQRRLYDLAIESALDEGLRLAPTTAGSAPEEGTTGEADASAAAGPVGAFEESIFLLSERSRARSLRSFLEGARFEARSHLDPDLAVREDQLQRQLQEISGQLLVAQQDSGDSRAVAKLEARVRLAEVDLEVLAVERSKRHPRQSGFLVPIAPSVDEVRQVLGERALLSFHLLEERSLLFLITAETVRLVHLPGREEIAAQVAELRKALERPSRFLGAFSGPAHRLWVDLIQPVASDIAGRRLVISPDGVLHGVPFEALLTEPARAGNGWGELPYAVRDYEIGYVPSAGVLVTLDRGNVSVPISASGPPSMLMAFGDPAVDDRIGSGAGFAASRSLSNARRLGLETRSGTPGFPPLPFARQEVRSLETVFGAGKIRVMVGAAATESQARSKAVSKARYLHFATHGFVDPDLPNQSALVLASDAHQDGLLQLREVLELRLAADLVVLSACETATGREYPGEGVASLSRAFLYAGASSLVASLWDVADRATSTLMVGFYRGLLEGHSKTRALRSAKLRLLEENRTSHPYYWAAFLLSGIQD